MVELKIQEFEIVCPLRENKSIFWPPSRENQFYDNPYFNYLRFTEILN